MYPGGRCPGAQYQCTCGLTDPLGVCAGCDYQSYYDAAYCYTDSDCSAACVQVPEVPKQASLAMYATGFLMSLGFVFKRRAG